MRLLRIIILSAFLLPFNIFGQEASSRLDSNWLKLMGPIKARCETINSLIKQLYKIKEIPAKELNSLAVLSDSLYASVQIKWKKDSTAINLLNNQNNGLTIALSNVYVFFESSVKASKNKKILDMIYRIEAYGNRIYLAKIEYNEACRDLNRMDLKFGDLSEGPPKVEF
ncbi:hypothetical protein [Pedobacter sp. UBA5917]|jgi:hypothetical protein|uniref:hypothetical protein n=1 Tax=Pedobacter sp. UBA5917 TaxID=1947061 RepID=UPI0025D22CB1|nr:hypothetical protein [Pedobacter sp. UBA5917]